MRPAPSSPPVPCVDVLKHPADRVILLVADKLGQAACCGRIQARLSGPHRVNAAEEALLDVAQPAALGDVAQQEMVADDRRWHSATIGAAGMLAP